MDFQRVKDKVMKGLFVGFGAFGSSFIDSAMGEYVDSEMGIAVGDIAIGTGASVLIDNYTEQGELVNDAVEHVGYGVAATGWSELGEQVTTGSNQTSGKVMRVSSNASRQTGASVERVSRVPDTADTDKKTETETSDRRAFSIDTA